jgi:hypothetical protein
MRAYSNIPFLGGSKSLPGKSIMADSPRRRLKAGTEFAWLAMYGLKGFCAAAVSGVSTTFKHGLLALKTQNFRVDPERLTNS